MPDIRNFREPARAARAIILALADATGSISSADLAAAAGIPERSIMHTVSDARRFVALFGGTIVTEGRVPNARYVLAAGNNATVLEAMGPVDRPPRARSIVGTEAWTPHLDAQMLSMAEAGNTTREIAHDLGVKSRMAVLGRLTRLRKAQTTEKGTPALGPDIVPRKPVGVTLPHVGAAYAYAFGRLLRDGVPVEGRV